MIALTAPAIPATVLVAALAAPSSVIIDRSSSDDGECSFGASPTSAASVHDSPCPPPEAFSARSEFDFAQRWDNNDGDHTDDSVDESESGSSSDSGASYISARQEEQEQYRTLPASTPVREGARVSFRSPHPVSDVRTRPATLESDSHGLYYSPDDFRAFRKEFRAVIKAKRAAIQKAEAHKQRMQDREEEAWYGLNPLSVVIGAIASAAWSAVPEVIVRAESISRQQQQQAQAYSIPDRLFHHHGF